MADSHSGVVYRTWAIILVLEAIKRCVFVAVRASMDERSDQQQAAQALA